jgi:hypothetical protein
MTDHEEHIKGIFVSSRYIVYPVRYTVRIYYLRSTHASLHKLISKDLVQRLSEPIDAFGIALTRKERTFRPCYIVCVLLASSL